MKLYNTLTKHVDTLEPQHAPEVSVYTCGPTVYDYPHIGNWFTFIRYDLLIRTIKAVGLQPKWVMNITDVGHLVSDADEGEDKLEKGAKREGKTAWDVARFYGDYFVEGLQRLNISNPDYLPKASEHIAEQIALVQELETKGYTYVIGDGVYFDTSKFPSYAHFAGLDIDEQQAGARVEYNPEKRNPTDFALWKLSPKDQQRDMGWDSPWGKGFPGWHIECSAMSMKYLGQTLDIHSGGIDHIPVHHSNEIAQSEAATGKPFAKYWMHTNHISVNGEKISKSLGNGITLEDIEAKGFSLQAFRLHVLESHYRSQSKFSWESLEAAQNRLNRWKSVAVLRFQSHFTNQGGTTFTLSSVREQIIATLADDLNTPQTLVLIDRLFDQIEAVGIHSDHVAEFEQLLVSIDAALGITLLEETDITDAQKQIVFAREQARAAKDWSHSDELRDQLAEQGIALRDTEHGAIWYRR